MTGRTAHGRGAAGPLAAVTLALSELVVAPGTARAAALFAPPITYVLGSGPVDVAVGELTGDGNDSLTPRRMPSVATFPNASGRAS